MLVIFTVKKMLSNELIYLAYQKYCQVFGYAKQDLEIVREGKPLFYSKGQKADVYFSLSHSGEYTFAAVSQRSVGIDIQKHDKKNINMAAVRLFGANMTENEFYDRFAAGEAHMKCCGKELLKALQETNSAKNFHFIKGYSLAIESDDNNIYFMEL